MSDDLPEFNADFFQSIRCELDDVFSSIPASFMRGEAACSQEEATQLANNFNRVFAKVEFLESSSRLNLICSKHSLCREGPYDPTQDVFIVSSVIALREYVQSRGVFVDVDCFVDAEQFSEPDFIEDPLDARIDADMLASLSDYQK